MIQTVLGAMNGGFLQTLKLFAVFALVFLLGT